MSDTRWVGDLTLDYEVLELPADPGLEIVTYSAPPGSPSEAALAELARRASTPRATDQRDGGSLTAAGRRQSTAARAKANRI